jgi:hypothetical protein
MHVYEQYTMLAHSQINGIDQGGIFVSVAFYFHVQCVQHFQAEDINTLGEVWVGLQRYY